MTLVSRLQQALANGHADTVLLTGDHVDPDAIVTALTQAAVLIPVTDRAEPGVILTRRTGANTGCRSRAYRLLKRWRNSRGA